MGNLLEDLKKYYTETSEEQIKKDWAKSEKYDQVGITVDDFIKINKSNMNELEKLREDFKKPRFNNFELEDTLRAIFIDETKNKLWAEKGDGDANFAEEYVFWLEELILSNK